MATDIPEYKEEDDSSPVAVDVELPPALGRVTPVRPAYRPQEEGRIPDDPVLRRQQSIARAEDEFAAKQRADNPFIFSNAVRKLADVGGRRYLERAVDEGEDAYRQQRMAEREMAVAERSRMAEEQRARNADREQQFRATGQKFYTDPYGDIQPVVDISGRPLYTPTKWRRGVHPKTGEPVLEMRDQFGQRQYKQPRLKTSDDPTDELMYYEFPDGEIVEAGPIQKFMQSDSPMVRKQARSAYMRRNEVLWKDAQALVDAESSIAEDKYKAALTRRDAANDERRKIAVQIAGLEAMPAFNETVGGVMGFGGQPSPTAQRLRQLRDVLQKRMADLTEEWRQLDLATGKGGELVLEKDRLGREAEAFRHRAKIALAVKKAEAYGDLAEQRRRLLRENNLPEDKDATLESIYQGLLDHKKQAEDGAAKVGLPVEEAATAPGWGTKIRAAVSNVLEGAGTGLVEAGEFAARNMIRGVPTAGMPTPGGGFIPYDAKTRKAMEAAKTEMQATVAEFSQAMRDEASQWGPDVAPEVAKQLENAWMTGKIPKAVGSALSFMAPVGALGSTGRALGLGEKALKALATAGVASMGASTEANAFRREAEGSLRKQLDAGQITHDEFINGLGMAEAFGGMMGSTEAVPMSRFVQRLSSLPLGRSFLQKMFEKAARGGAARAAKWVQSEGGEILAEAIEEGGQEFIQSMGEDLYAAKTFDPNRKVGAEAPESAEIGGIVGALLSVATKIIGRRGGGPRREQAAPVEPGPAPAAPATGPETQPAGNFPVDDTAPEDVAVRPLSPEEEELARALEAQPVEEAASVAEAIEAAPVQEEATLAPEDVPVTEVAESAPATEEGAAGRPPVVEMSPEEMAKDRAQYDMLQRRMSELLRSGGAEAVNSTEYQSAWQASEDIKNRHGGFVPEEGGATLYHGSSANPELGRASPGDESGFFATPHKELADWYANSDIRNSRSDAGKVYEVANPSKPLDLVRDKNGVNFLANHMRASVEEAENSYLDGVGPWRNRNPSRAVAAIKKLDQAIAAKYPNEIAEARAIDAALRNVAVEYSMAKTGKISGGGSILNDALRASGYDAVKTYESHPGTGRGDYEVFFYVDRPKLKPITGEPTNASRIESTAQVGEQPVWTPSPGGEGREGVEQREQRVEPAGAQEATPREAPVQQAVEEEFGDEPVRMEVPAPISGAEVVKTKDGATIKPTEAKEKRVAEMGKTKAIKAQKEFLSEALRKAAETAPERSKEMSDDLEEMSSVSAKFLPEYKDRFYKKYRDFITVEVPDDGTYRIHNNKQSLLEFADKVDKKFGKGLMPKEYRNRTVPKLTDAERAEIQESPTSAEALPTAPTPADASVSSAVKARQRGEDQARLESVWQRLMRAPLAEKSQVASEYSPAEAKDALDRLNAAPGFDNDVKTALEERIAGPVEPVAIKEDIALKPPTMMKRAELRAELAAAGITQTAKGVPIAEANPAQLMAAVGQLRSGELTAEGVKPGAEPRTSDKIIEALQKAKIRKPGELSAAAEPFTIAYDAAIDLAIVSIRAGRALADVIKMAVARFRAMHKDATDAEVAKLTAAIEAAAKEPQPTKTGPGAGGPPSGMTFTGPVNPGIPEFRKRSKSALGEYEYVATTNRGQQKYAQEFADWHEKNGTPESAIAEMRGINEPAMRAAVGGELLARTMQQWEAAPAEKKPELMARAASLMGDVKAEKTEAGQALKAQGMVNERLAPYVPMLDWMDLLRQRYKSEIQTKVGDETGAKIKEGINEAGNEAAAKLAEAITGDKADEFLSKHTGTLNLLRKAAKSSGLKWVDVFSALPENQEARRAELFDRVKADPKLAKLSDAQRKLLADRMNEAWTVLRNNIFKQEFGRLVPLPNIGKEDQKKVRSVIGELIKFSNMGMLNNEAFLSALADRYGLEKLDGPTAKKLGEIAGRLQRAKNDAERARLNIEMYEAVAKSRGLSVQDALMSGFYSNLLNSFVTTGYAMMGGNLIQTTWNLGTLALSPVVRGGNVKKAAALAPAMLRGLRTGIPSGLREAVSILTTGHGGEDAAAKLAEAKGEPLEMIAKGNVWEDWMKANPLKSKTVRGVAQMSKFVPRIARAIDAMFYYPAKQAALRWLTEQTLLAEYTDPTARAKKAAELLKVTPADFMAAEKKARDEGFSGLDMSLRIADLLEPKSALMRLKRSSETARYLTDQQWTEQKAAVGAQLAEEGAIFGSKSTLNMEPEGWAGVAYDITAGGLERFRPLGFPVGKLFAPFLKLPTNFYNANLGPTPFGMVTALRGSVATGKWRPTNKQVRLLSENERNQLHFQSLVGAMTMLYYTLKALAADPEKGDGFDITANGPADKALRRQLEGHGWKKKSVRIPGTDIWVDYMNTPMAIPLSIVGHLTDAIRFQKKKEDLIGGDLPIPLISNALLDAAVRFPSVIFGMPALSGMIQLGDLLDEENVDARKVSRFLTQSSKNFVRPRVIEEVDRIFDPVVRYEGVAQYDELGEPVEQSPLKRIASRESSDPLRRVLLKRFLVIPTAGRDTHLNGVPMTPEQHAEYLKISGTEIRQMLRPAVALLERLPKAEAQKYIDRVTATARERARTQLEAIAPPPPTVKR
jgi:hypothetical protein